MSSPWELIPSMRLAMKLQVARVETSPKRTHKLGSGTNSGPCFLKVLFLGFFMDMLKTVVASWIQWFPFFPLNWSCHFVSRYDRKLQKTINSLSSMGSNILQTWISNMCFAICLSRPCFQPHRLRRFGQTLLQVFLVVVPPGKRPYTCLNPFAVSFCFLVFGLERKRNVAFHLTPPGQGFGFHSILVNFICSGSHCRSITMHVRSHQRSPFPHPPSCPTQIPTQFPTTITWFPPGNSPLVIRARLVANAHNF